MRPQQIIIGTSAYVVHWDQESWDQLKLDNNGLSSGLFGRTTITTEEIWIRPDTSLNQQADTLLHEVMHACYNTAGVALDGYDDQEEGHIATLTPWLLLAMRDNPDLVSYLLDPTVE